SSSIEQRTRRITRSAVAADADSGAAGSRQRDALDGDERERRSLRARIARATVFNRLAAACVAMLYTSRARQTVAVFVTGLVLAALAFWGHIKKGNATTPG